MTENQLMTTDIQFGVSYTPSEIIIENEEQLASLIDQVTEYYSKQLFTDENISDAKTARADLNKIITQLESRRKEIKQGFTAPLSQFEAKMKVYVNQIQEVSSDIGAGIKTYEDAEKAQRLEKIQMEMAKIAQQFDVDPQSVEISTTWLTKTAFTTKGEVKGKVLDEIKDKLKIVAMERDRIEADKATITDYAELAGLDPYAWAELVDQGWSVADIREKIKQAIDDKKIREAAAEEARKNREEYETAMKELEQSQTVETNHGTFIDRETGEIVSIDESVQENQVNSLPEMTVTLQLTGTQAQLMSLNEYILDHNITVVPVER